MYYILLLGLYFKFTVKITGVTDDDNDEDNNDVIFDADAWLRSLTCEEVESLMEVLKNWNYCFLDNKVQ